MSAAGRGMVLGDGGVRVGRGMGHWSALAVRLSPVPAGGVDGSGVRAAGLDLCPAVGLLLAGGCPGRGGHSPPLPRSLHWGGLGVAGAARSVPATSPLPGRPGSMVSVGECTRCYWRDGDQPLCPSPKVSPSQWPHGGTGLGSDGGFQTCTALLPHCHCHGPPSDGRPEGPQTAHHCQMGSVHRCQLPGHCPSRGQGCNSPD